MTSLVIPSDTPSVPPGSDVLPPPLLLEFVVAVVAVLVAVVADVALDTPVPDTLALALPPPSSLHHV